MSATSFDEEERAAVRRGGRAAFVAAVLAGGGAFALSVVAPSLPWPLVAVVLGALFARAVRARGSGAPHEPALTLGFALLGAEVRLDALTELGGAAVAAPLVFWSALFAVGAAARALGLIDGRSAGLVALGVCGGGLPPLLVAVARDARVHDDQRSVALWVVLVSGLVGSAALPHLAVAFGLDARAAGLWLGTVVSQTTQARAGAAHLAPDAIATVAAVKLFLLVVQGGPLLAYLTGSRALFGATEPGATEPGARVVGRRGLGRAASGIASALMPRHALAFVATATLSNLVEVGDTVRGVASIGVTVSFAYLLAVVGAQLLVLGRRAPWRFVVTGLVQWIVAAAALALALVGTSASQRATVAGMTTSDVQRHLVVLTGAGISVDSGVPSYRGADGLWEGHRLEEVATPEAWARDPATVWRFYQQRRAGLAAVAPNAAHRALVDAARRVTDAGGRFTLVSQNVDDLHQRAGSRVVAMHGQLVELACEACGAVVVDREHLDPHAFVPCGACGFERLRPNVVWFGEVPHHLDAIERAIEGCTDFLAIGTSGVVYPAAGMLAAARELGRRTWVQSLDEPENLDPADRFRPGRAAEVVPGLIEEVLGGRSGGGRA